MTRGCNDCSAEQICIRDYLLSNPTILNATWASARGGASFSADWLDATVKCYFKNLFKIDPTKYPPGKKSTSMPMNVSKYSRLSFGVISSGTDV
jgi:hypothetical protein